MFKYLQAWLSFLTFYAVDGEGGGDLDGDAITDAFSGILNPPTAEETAETEQKTLADKAKALAEPTEESEEEEAPEEDSTFTIEVDGKSVELTKEQIAEAYKNGLRQDDYSRKTMAVAEERKAAEAEKTKATQDRNDYAEKLTTYAIQLQGMLQESQNINWDELMTQDPVRYLQEKALLEKRHAALNQAKAEHDQIKLVNEAEAKDAREAFLHTQQQELIAKLPAWKDEAKAKAEKSEMKDFLKGQGFNDQDISMIEDHRSVLIVRNARLFDKLRKQAPSATKRVEKAPAKVERPGVGGEDNDARTKVMNNVRKSKSLTQEQTTAAFAAIFN